MGLKEFKKTKGKTERPNDMTIFQLSALPLYYSFHSDLFCKGVKVGEGEEEWVEKVKVKE